MRPPTFDPVGPPHSPGLLDPDAHVHGTNVAVHRDQPIPDADPRNVPLVEVRPPAADVIYTLRRFGSQLAGRWNGLHAVIEGPGVTIRDSYLVREAMGNGTPYPTVDFIPAHNVDCLVPRLEPEAMP